MMEVVTDPELFRSAPAGRIYVGPCWVVWCWNPSLTGSIVWGRPSEPEVRGLVRMYEIEEHLAPNFDVVTDASRMSMVAPAVFSVVFDYLRGKQAEFVKRIRKNAVVVPPGLLGAALAGIYPMLGSKVNWRPTQTMQAALDWLDTDAARAAGVQLHQMIEQYSGRSALLHKLHEYLRAHLIDASIDGAARALGTSRRSLQRSLANGKTRFRDELEAVRIDEASRRLAEGDEKLEALALELGFSSASHFGSTYLAATGETPGEFRARYKQGP